jgi:hypothetical protein
MNKLLSVLAIIAVAGLASQAAIADDQAAEAKKEEEKVCVVAKADGNAQWVAKADADKQIADGSATAVAAEEVATKCPAEEEAAPPAAE